MTTIDLSSNPYDYKSSNKISISTADALKLLQTLPIFKFSGRKENGNRLPSAQNKLPGIPHKH